MFGIARRLKSEHPNKGEDSARSRHVVEIIRPEVLGQWALEKNQSLELLHEAMHDWGERLGDPSQRPVCLTCPHEFQAERTLPPAWMFVRLSVNEAGIPNKMTLIGICERCAPNDDSSVRDADERARKRRYGSGWIILLQLGVTCLWRMSLRGMG